MYPLHWLGSRSAKAFGHRRLGGSAGRRDHQLSLTLSARGMLATHRDNLCAQGKYYPEVWGGWNGRAGNMVRDSSAVMTMEFCIPRSQ